MSTSSHSDDTVDLPKVETDDGNTKRCCQCGKDLRGHRRFKDSVGYWCKDCHRVDKQRNTVPEGRCPDCGRMRPLDKLFATEDGTQVCSSCLKERAAKAEKYAIKMMATQEEVKAKYFKLYLLGGIAAFLILILIVGQVLRLLK